MTPFKRITAFLFAINFAINFLIISTLVFLPSQTASAADNGKITIVIDPGHGGASDPGTCKGSEAERHYTLALALKLKALLEANGNFNVFMTRTTDTEMKIASRVKFAYDHDADILISLHFDGNAVSSVNGTTAYTSVFDRFAMVDLARKFTSNISSAMGMKNNGCVQRQDPGDFYWSYEKQWDIEDPSLGVLADYYGIPCWGCKFGINTIIVEHGYFTNAGDAAAIMGNGGLDKLAKADADALISYYTGHTHTYGAKQVDFPSNCVYRGKSSSRCTVCKKRVNITTLETAPDNHFYYSESTTTQKVYCDQKQVVSYKCRISDNLNIKGIDCPDHSIVNVIKPATAHNYVVTYHQELGHVTDGITTYSCTNCPATYTETVAAEGHTWILIKHTLPTCTEDGTNEYKCPVCSEFYTETVPATGHSFVRTELIKSESCTEDGEESVVCTVCDFETNRAIPATGHSGYLLEHMDSTCAVRGYDKYMCYVCREEYFEYIEMPEHVYALTEKTELTCTEDEKEVYTCENCGNVKEEVIALASHNFEKTEHIDETCETDGKTVYVCSRCGEEKVEVTKAAGHRWNTGEITKKGGFFTSGNKRYLCLNDSSHVRNDILPSRFSSSAEAKIVVIMTVVFIALSAGVAFLEKYKVIPFPWRKAEPAAEDALAEETPGAETAKEPETVVTAEENTADTESTEPIEQNTDAESVEHEETDADAAMAGTK